MTRRVHCNAKREMSLTDYCTLKSKPDFFLPHFHFSLFTALVVLSVHCFVTYFTVILTMKTVNYFLVPPGLVVDLIPSPSLGN